MRRAEKALGSAQEQGDLWSERAVDWAEVQEGMAQPLYDVVLDRTGIGPDTTVLDVGCGSGMFCAMAAARGAEVFGIDASPALLSIARERVPQGSFDPGELEDLPYEAHAFDIVTGFNSFQYATDPVNAVREAARVVREGAPVVIAVWGDPADCQAAACFAAFGPLLPPAPGAPGPFTLSGPAALEGLVRQAGLTPGVMEDVGCVWQYDDLATALRGLLSDGTAVHAIRHS